MFEQEKYLGAIIPPMDMYGKFSSSYESQRNLIHRIRGFMCRKSLISEKMIQDILLKLRDMRKFLKT